MPHSISHSPKALRNDFMRTGAVYLSNPSIEQKWDPQT
ncbi:hypothetical protein VPHF86_0304 [Vibrio phage F86]